MEYGTDNNARWWARKRQVHEDVWRVAKKIEAEQSGRRSLHREYKRLYEDSWNGVSPETRNVVSFNLVRSCIDTVCSKISKNKPRVQILTNDGDWFLKDKAERLNKFIDGQFAEMNFHHKAQLVFRDACIFDGGVLRVYRDPDSEKIKCERVFPWEILIDSQESLYGEPRQVFLKRAVHRDVLAALYPKKRGFIETAPASRSGSGRDNNAMVDVVESWHLPSAEGAKDGRHVICIESATLHDDEYARSDFPFVFFHWQDPIEGFWMPGLAQELWGLQAELNTHLENIRVAHKRMGRPGAFLRNGAKIDDVDINNEIGVIVRGEEPPVFFQTPVMHPQIYAWTDKLKSFGYEAPGISEAAAHARKPAGVESGAAIREVNDIETERFVLAGQRYERMYREAAEKIIRLAREMYEDGVDLTIKARDRKFIESIVWSDVDMDDDSYQLSIFETSGLPQRPEGRIQTAVELSSSGLMSPENAAEMLTGIADVDSAMDVERAPRVNIDRMLDKMLREDVQLTPLPYNNLELAKARTVLKLNWCDVEGVPENAKARLLTFLAQVEDMLGAAAPPAPAMPPPMPPGGGGGMPLPAVDMPMPVDPSTLAATMPEVGGMPLPPEVMAA